MTRSPIMWLSTAAGFLTQKGSDMSTNSGRRSHLHCGLILLTLLTVACAAPDEQSRTDAPTDIPRFRVDPFWASELPNNWMLGFGVLGDWRRRYNPPPDQLGRVRTCYDV